MIDELPNQNTDVSAKQADASPSPKTSLWPAEGILHHVAIVFVLGAVVLFSNVNTLHNSGFALDNKFIILEDPRLRDACGNQPPNEECRKKNWENVKLIFSQDYWYPKAVSGLYRPLTTLSYRLNYTFLGNKDSAAGYHWVNFFLHWLNAVLVYFMVMVLIEKLWPAFFTGALFAVHPITVESVANMVGRADLFATIVVIGGFLLYAKSATCTGWKKVPWLLGLMVLTGLGVFCKESAVVVAPVLVVYDLTFRLRRQHANWLVSVIKNYWEFFWKGYIALVPPLILLFYVRSQIFAKLRPPELPFVDNPMIDWPFWNARLTGIKVIGKYFWLLVWPQHLSCDYSYNQIPLVRFSFSSWEDWKAIIALVSVIAVLVVAWRSFTRNKAVFFFIAFFFVTFLPSSNMVPNPTFGQSIFDKVSWCIGSIMAERFMYLPSIGFAGCLVIAAYAACRAIIPKLDISEWTQRLWLQAIARTVLVLILIAYSIRTFIRNEDWEDDERLWLKAAEVCPDSFKSHKSLAFALYEKDPEGKNIDRIIQEGEKALAITRRTQIVFLHLGAYYRIKGDTLAKRNPDSSLVPSLASNPWYQKSIDVLDDAIPLDREFNGDNRAKEIRRGHNPDTIPDIGNHEIYWNLGLSCMRLGKYNKALEAYLYMRHLSPTNPDAYISLASVYIAKGQAEDAAIALLQTLLLDSNRQEAIRLLIEIYRQTDPNGCAIAYGQNQTQPKLNADCPIVHRHICAAYRELIKVFLEAKQFDLAKETKKSALKSYNCPKDELDKLVPDTGNTPVTIVTNTPPVTTNPAGATNTPPATITK
jgi:tetratricopeptide (TPR) repeat protein